MAEVPKRSVRTELIDDPRHLGRPFAEMRQALDRLDYAPLFRQHENEVAQDHAGYFQRSAGPDGAPWAPLSPVTVEKKGHSRILLDTEAMRRSLIHVGDPAHVSDVERRYLVFGTSDPKAPFHQSGTQRMPARPPVGLTPARADAIAADVADFVVESLKG